MYLKHFACVNMLLSCANIRGGSCIYLKTLAVFLLLLVYYTQAKVDFVGLFKIGLHLHDLRESFLGVIQRTVSIVQYANAIP